MPVSLPEVEMLPARIVCRIAECLYQVAGPREFVKKNYRHHLREDHKMRCPKVEGDEIK